MSKSVLIHIEGRDKDEYLTGDVKKPPRENPKYRKWKTENAMVKGWLLSSMKQIWDSLTKVYLEVGHTAKVFDLKQRIA